MAKHSHWDNIKHQKGANDRKKAAIISKMGKLITVAVAMGGPNPDDNPRLRLAMAKARAAQMSNEPIERAIKKAAGEAGAGRTMDEVSYEGYGPGGLALVVDVLTDNRNRTAPEIKKLFERAGGAIGAPGCVAWQFKAKCMYLVQAAEEAVMEALLAGGADAEDLQPVESEDDVRTSVIADPAQFDAIAKACAAAKIKVIEAIMTKLPDNRVEVAAEHKAAIEVLLEALDDHDDVQEVYNNGDW